MCNYCENKTKKKLIHDSEFDTESMIFSIIDLQIKDNNIIATANSSYECEEVVEHGLEEKTIKTTITRLIPINYCPICGRQLKDR